MDWPAIDAEEVSRIQRHSKEKMKSFIAMKNASRIIDKETQY
jgi:hypothetical protein